MTRPHWIRIGVTVIIAIAVLFFIRLHFAGGETLPRTGGTATGHKLASVWCVECHSIEANAPFSGKPAPDFAAIANQPSTTELMLKVFLQSNHRSMPNFIISKNDAADIVAYILSLKRN